MHIGSQRGRLARQNSLESRCNLNNQGFIANEIELERDIQGKLLDWKRKRHNIVLQVEGPVRLGRPMRFGSLLI